MNISGTQSRKYPYGAAGVPEESKIYRYMDVDIIGFLGKIAGKTILRNRNNWKDDIEKLRKAALSKNLENKRLIWLVSGSGTHLITEYEAFIEDTPASRHMKENRESEKDMSGYIIEVGETENGRVKGNVFEIGSFNDYAWYVRDTAVPLDSVTITYMDGNEGFRAETVPHYEYARDYKQLMGGDAIVADICYNPHAYNGRYISAVMQKEHANSMKLPIGSIEAHLEKLETKLANLRGYRQMQPTEELPGKSTAAKGKPSIAAALKVADMHAKKYNAQKAQMHKSRNINTAKEII